MGGSHGGFLSAWLASHPEFSEKVKCSLIINGVTYAPGNLTGSNIPDWIFATLPSEKREISWPISPEDL